MYIYVYHISFGIRKKGLHQNGWPRVIYTTLIRPWVGLYRHTNSLDGSGGGWHANVPASNF